MQPSGSDVVYPDAGSAKLTRKDAADRQIIMTSVVSPCKQSPSIKNSFYGLKSNSQEAATNLQQSRTPHLPDEVENNHFPILEMMGSLESTESADSSVQAASRAAAAAVSGELGARTSAISTSLAFRHSPEMMVFPEPDFANEKPNVNMNPFAIRPPTALLEFDYSNMETFYGAKGSFDSNKGEDSNGAHRRRHSLDLTSPHDTNPGLKQFKQSQSLPYEVGHGYNHLASPLALFGSNNSDLTPIRVGTTPQVPNEPLPHKPSSSPVPIAPPPKLGVTKIIFRPSHASTTRIFLHPKANKIDVVPCDFNSRDKRQSSSTMAGFNVKRPKLTLPPQLVPDDKEGRRRVVINGPSKQCTDTRLDKSAAASESQAANKGNVVISTNPNLKSSTELIGNAHFHFLKSIHPALDGCTFLLPCLKKRMAPKNPCNIPGLKINVSTCGSFKLRYDHLTHEYGPTPAELTMAKRRIESAICAFGGSIKRKKKVASNSIPGSSSIFRVSQQKKNSKPKAIKGSRRHRNQYFDNGKILSWEVEANISFDKKDIAGKKEKQHVSERKIERLPSALSRASSMDQSESSKKYKCSLCGQLKQSHRCPFRSTMLRNVGVMAYPCVNAYAADEPGTLAPSLCEMNNFILLGSQSFDIANSMSFDGATSANISQSTLTSAFERKAIVIEPKKSIPSNGIRGLNCKYRRNKPPSVTISCSSNETSTSSKEQESELLFQPTMEITQEQYRMVSTSLPNKSSKRAPYTYPTVPMTYSQRESMSDKLFRLAKQVPGLAKECNLVLKEERNGDDWDLAVAELMAQVVCILFCSRDNDFKLDGLSRYLLQLGISC